MKKAFLMVLACLLLAGCGAPTGTTAKVPETRRRSRSPLPPW